jgi:hypothetical protein
MDDDDDNNNDDDDDDDDIEVFLLAQIYHQNYSSKHRTFSSCKSLAHSPERKETKDRTRRSPKKKKKNAVQKKFRSRRSSARKGDMALFSLSSLLFFSCVFVQAPPLRAGER